MRVATGVVIDIVLGAVIDTIITIMMTVVPEAANTLVEETGARVHAGVIDMTVLAPGGKLDRILGVLSLDSKEALQWSQRR